MTKPICEVDFDWSREKFKAAMVKVEAALWRTRNADRILTGMILGGVGDEPSTDLEVSLYRPERR